MTAPVEPAVQDLLVTRVADGQAVLLQSLWENRRVALVFLRHLGCRFCLEQANALVKTAIGRRLAEFGTSLVVVSLGSVDEARAWLTKTGFEGELYVDTSTDGSSGPSVQENAHQGSLPYRAFRLKRGRQFTTKHEGMRAKAQATGEKFPDSVPVREGDVNIYPGDVFQVGGAFIIGPGNSCDFAFRAEYAGDLIDLDALEVAATGQKSDGAEYVYPSTLAWFEKLGLGTLYNADAQSLQSRLWQLTVQHWRRIATVAAAAWSLRAALVAKEMRAAGAFGLLGVALLASDVASLLGFRRQKLSCKFDLMTPKDIDAMAHTLGAMQCDCSGLMSTIPMLDTTTPEEASLQALPASRLRSQEAETLEGRPGASGRIAGQVREYQSMICYVREFLAKPHPAVGRSGPVCPFVPKSLTMNAVKMSVVRTAHIPSHELREELGRLLIDFIPRFEAMEPTTGRQRQYKTVILIFPDVAIGDANAIIDGAQAVAKIEFVSRGLMVGEFHAANNAAGLRNPNFFPLRTPHPCLALRHMVPGDYVFMTLDAYPVHLQRKFLESFLGVFGEEDRAETRDAREKLQKLQV